MAEMRLIDANALKFQNVAEVNGKLTHVLLPEEIDNAPVIIWCSQTPEGLPLMDLRERQQGEWIPVSERLPNTLGVYNVTRKLKEGETIYSISSASYFDGQNTWHADTGINHGRQYLTDIIAWQPLPEPYKKVDVI